MFMPGSAPLDDFQAPLEAAGGAGPPEAEIRRGDDTVGNPHRAQISQFELFEFVLVLK